jgi:hypothetical protein
MEDLHSKHENKDGLESDRRQVTPQEGLLTDNRDQVKTDKKE